MHAPALLAGLTLAAAAAPGAAQAERVLVVGDSWSHLEAPELQEVFQFFGHGDKLVVNSGIPGATAAALSTPPLLAQITAGLQAHPTVDVVHLSIGGNDFLGAWSAGLAPAAEAQLLDGIAADVDAIVQHALAFHPKIRVVIVGYDYLNFVETVIGDPFGPCGLQWLLMGSPTALALNEALLDLEGRKRALADASPRVAYVDVFGFMQEFFGYPGLGLPPFSPLLPDKGLPSPPEALDAGGKDCIHLNEEGYEIVCTHAWNAFYGEHFQPSFQPVLHPPAPGTAGSFSVLAVTGMPPGAQVLFAAGVQAGALPLPACPFVSLGFLDPILLAALPADPGGAASFGAAVPAGLAGLTLQFQAIAIGPCVATAALAWTF